MMRLLSALILMALLACAPVGGNGQADAAPPDVSLSIEPREVSAGDSLTLTLSNATSGAVGYNLCASRLERRVQSEWEPVPEDRFCTLELRSLPPGDDATYSLQLSSELEAGEYRFVTNVAMLDGTESKPVGSATFRVTG